jgi:Ca2+-binding RTX toxin-like protein
MQATFNEGYLNWGSKWPTGNISYTYLTAIPFYYQSTDSFQPALKLTTPSMFNAFTPTQALAADGARIAWASVANINWTPVEQDNAAQKIGDVTFGRYLILPTGGAPFALAPEIEKYLPPQITQNASPLYGGDIWFDTFRFASNMSPGTFGFYDVMHELGHALGLAHDGQGDAAINPSTPAVVIPDGSLLTTVMSYTRSPSDPIQEKLVPNAAGLYPITPMVYDIAAIQRLYGPNTTYKDDNTDWIFTDTKNPFGEQAPGTVLMTLWDPKGDDTVDASGMSTQVLIDLAPGGFSSIGFDDKSKFNVGIALKGSVDTAVIENAKGGKGNDSLFGNDVANTLEGNDGNDELRGGKGNDTLKGGKDFDTYIIGQGTDTLIDEDGKGLVKDTGGNLVVGLFVKDTGGDTYTLAGGTGATAVKSGTTLTVTPKSGDAFIIQNFKDGDLGIRLKDALADFKNPDTTNPIVGDKKPQDMDPVADGIQTGFDDLGNLIVSAEAEPDRTDLLHDSAANDLIDAGGGNDVIIATRGGNDIFLAGTGDDSVTAGAGNDKIVAGAGMDVVMAGTGADKVDGGAGSDKLFGGAGDDIILGGTDGDILDGGEGNDRLYANAEIDLAQAVAQGNIQTGSGNKGDWLNSGAGDDVLVAGADNDVLNGGAGSDVLIGGAGDDDFDGDFVWQATSLSWTMSRSETVKNGRVVDFVVSYSGVEGLAQDVDIGDADVIYGGSGEDWIYGRGGDDYMDGGNGNDDIAGGTGSDILIGGLGNDKLFGDKSGGHNTDTDGVDYLDGGDGNDELWGNGGEDILIGGKGNDYLNGGAGRDTYVFNKGDGVETIDDTPADPKKYKGEASIVVLGEGIKRSDVVFSKGSLLIDLGSSDPSDPYSRHDAIHFQGFDYEDPEATPMIGELRFADGQVMTYADVLAQGFDINGTDGDDDGHDAGHETLVGTGVTDRIRGYGGNDILVGLRGDDILRGGAGDDTYVFNLGDGADTIIDHEGSDSILFGSGINPDAVSLTATDGLLMVQYSAQDSISIQGVVHQYKFDDGTTIGYEDMMARLSGALSVVGTTANELIVGGAGNDTLWGGGGNDTLKGAAGDDYLYGEDGHDIVDGGAGNDVLSGGVGNDTLLGGAGNDTLFGGIGRNYMDGGDGDNVFHGGAGDDTIVGGSGNNAICGGSGTGTIIAGTGSTTFVLQPGMGDYIIVGNAAGRQTIQLGPQMDLSNVVAYKQGNDLVIGTQGIAGNERSSLTLQGYYTSSNDWAIQDGSGNSATPQALVDRTTEAQIVAQMETRLLESARNAWLNNVYTGGFILQSDGSWYQPPRLQGSASALRSTTTSTFTYGASADSSGPGGTSTTQQESWSSLGSNLSVRALTERILSDTITATDEVVNVQSSFVINNYNYIGTTLVPMKWSVSYSWPPSSSQTVVSGYVYTDGSFGLTPAPGAVPATAVKTSTTTTSAVNAASVMADGKVDISSLASSDSFTHWWSDPALWSSAMPLSVYDDSLTIHIDQINLGLGNHTVQGDASLAVLNAGSGDNVITGTFGFIYTGTGSNTIENADTIYEGSGNSVISYATTIYEGSGNNIIEEAEVVYAGSGNNLIGDIDEAYYGGSGSATIQRVRGATIYGGSGSIELEHTWSATVYGGSGNLTAYDAEDATVYGGSGDDLMVGSYSTFVAGGGNDTMFGQDSGMNFVIDPNVVDHVLVGGTTYSNGFSVLDAFYRSQGIDSWAASYLNPGMYTDSYGRTFTPQYVSDNLNSSWDLFWWTGTTFQQAIDSGQLVYGAPLPVVARLGDGSWTPPNDYYSTSGIPTITFSADNFAALAPLYEQGFLQPAAKVTFGGNLKPGDLHFSWGHATTALSGVPTDPQLSYMTLNLDWGTGQDVRVVVPNATDAIGSGVQVFGFADGSQLTLADMLATANQQSDKILHLEKGDGQITIALDKFTSLQFGADLAPGNITISRSGSDVVLSDGLDTWLLSDWFADPAHRPVLDAKFADGTIWHAAELEPKVAVLGTDGDDYLSATSDDVGCIFMGGQGDDTLAGGLSDDTYVFNLGDGIDHITDGGGADTIRFGTGITPDSLSLGLGSLLIRTGAGDAIHIDGFDPANASSNLIIESFAFADGTTLTYEQLLAKGFDLAGAETITGTSVIDRITGSAGDDVITGGRGNDVLTGGAGNDGYVFNLGDGTDVIHDVAAPGAGNHIVFGAGIARDALQFERGNGTLTLRYSAGDAIVLSDFNLFGNGGTLVVGTVEFADGTTASLADLVNQAPVTDTGIATQLANEDAAFTFQIPANAFLDEDAGDVLTLSATLADGAALPSWLTFDSATRTLSGTPANGEVGSIAVKVTAVDTFGKAVSQVFGVTVSNTNDAPVLAHAIGDQAATEDAPFSFTIAADAFTDVDAADSLVLTAALANGDPLPSWLSFDAATRTFSGIPANGDVGTLSVKVTGTDVAGAIASDVFDLTIANTNDAPTVSHAIADQVVAEGSAFSFTVPADTFADVDAGDSLTYTATMANGQALPSWLTFNAQAGTISGIPAYANIGTLDVTIRATDGGGLSTFAGFKLDITRAANQTLIGTEGADILTARSGDDSLQGLGANDQLFGGAGNDVLDGGAGADSMSGGLGNDTYVVDNAADVVTENANEGVDTVQSSVTWTLGNNVENLTLTGAAAINGTGNALDNVLTGNSAANIFKGGLGNDTYVVGAGDTVSESANQGTDMVIADFNYTLGSNVENLTLAGTGDINGTGNTLNNVLTGNGGANVLNGSTGADTLIGGAGNDSYTVDNINDVVIENADEGIDTVSTTVTYTLAANIENLKLTGTGAINGTGNQLANVLTGNSVGNLLSGLEGNDSLIGGAGADTLIGGSGDDVYTVDNLGDVVVEATNEGLDTVNSSVSYALSVNIENLTLTGTGSVNATGNAMDNTIIGNAGSNILDGGAGADTMIGGKGNDTYYVDHAGDLVTENAAEGTDTVKSTIDYVLADTLENLTLLAEAVHGTGNAANNVMVGNASANVLAGGAGNDIFDGAGGADTLIGGAGNDTYLVNDSTVVIQEAAAEGTDLVKASADYTLSDNIENLTMVGFEAINGYGNAGSNVMTGNMAANLLYGDAGNDTFDGAGGADTLIGGLGNDLYLVNDAAVLIQEGLNEGVDTVKSTVDYTLAANVDNLTLMGVANLNGAGNDGNNTITGNTGNNTLMGGAGNDVLSGGGGIDLLFGGAGNDTYTVNDSLVSITEYANEGVDTVKSAINYTLGDHLENLTLTGTAANGFGNALNNILTGNTLDNLLEGYGGDDTLQGNAANDVLQGGEGNDSVKDSGGNNLLTGGAGNDALTAGAGNDVLIGGAGNDTLTTGAGADLIAFNRGDGQDTVIASTGKDNTISLAGIRYADLLFKKSGNNLILVTGINEQITLKDWYLSVTNHSVANLQVVIQGTADYDAASASAMANRKVEQFDFDALVAKFDQARTATPSMTQWSLMNGLLDAHLAGSDTAALGGDLAYQYAASGTLAGISLAAAQEVLASASLNAQAQTLRSRSELEQGAVRLG